MTFQQVLKGSKIGDEEEVTGEEEEATKPNWLTVI